MTQVSPRPPNEAAAAPPGEAAPPPRPGPLRRGLARVRLRSRPARIVGLAVLAISVVSTLFSLTNGAIGDARDGLHVIGHQAGPQVVATANLYFALSDMDTQVSNILLYGNGDNGKGAKFQLGFNRDQSRGVYDTDRRAADMAALRALALTGADPDQQATVRDLLDGMGQYEQLAAQAMQLDEQSGHKPGAAPANVLSVQRKATDLMRESLLPKAYNLTLDSGSIVRRTYDDKRGAVLAERWWVGLAGVAAVAVLVALQVYLSRRFRRVVNPALALATLACLAFTVVAMVLLSNEASHLREAKVRGFDSVLALSRTRAISNAMNSDESRYLLDPRRADTYDQVYLAKAQSILYVPSVDLQAYYRGVNQGLDPVGMPRAPMQGFLGAEAQHTTLPGQAPVLARALNGFRQFQRSDARVRDLARKGDRRAAVAVRLGQAEGATNVDFALYDLSTSSLIDIHQQTFAQAIDNGDTAISGWNIALPVTGLVVVALIVIGVRPRIAEYR